MTTPELSSLFLHAILSQSALTEFPYDFTEKSREMDLVPDSPAVMSDDEDMGSAAESVDAEGIPVSPVLHPVPPCREYLLPVDDDFVLC